MMRDLGGTIAPRIWLGVLFRSTGWHCPLLRRPSPTSSTPRRTSVHRSSRKVTSAYNVNLGFQWTSKFSHGRRLTTVEHLFFSAGVADMKKFKVNFIVQSATSCTRFRTRVLNTWQGKLQVLNENTATHSTSAMRAIGPTPTSWTARCDSS